VLDAAGEEDEAALPGVEGLVPAPGRDVALEDVEDLVLGRMRVVPWLLAAPGLVLEDGEPPALAQLAHLDGEVDPVGGEGWKAVGPALAGLEGVGLRRTSFSPVHGFSVHVSIWLWNLSGRLNQAGTFGSWRVRLSVATSRLQ
jgi:hypothetical protein